MLNWDELDGQYLLFALAVLAAAWIIFHGLRTFGKLRARLGKLTDELEAMTDVLAACDRPAAFAADYQRVSTAAGTGPITGAVWREFARTLVWSDGLRPERAPADAVDDDVAVRSPRPASDVFNISIIDRSEIDFRSFDGVPNELVGLGLMFTFIFLVLTLAIASAGLQGNTADLQRALDRLIVAVGSKFLTSVVAIFASLLFTFFKNQELNKLDRKLEQLCARLDALVPPIAHEELALASRDELAHQSALLSKGNVDLAQEIAVQLDKTLRANLPEAIAPLIGEVRAMVQNIGEINESILNNLIRGFIDQLGTSVQQHSDNMIKTLGEVSLAIEAMPAQIKAAGDRFELVFDGVTERIEATLQGSAQSLEALLRQAGDSVAASGTALGAISEQLRTMLAEVQATEQAIGARGERAEAAGQQALSDLARGAGQVASATTALQPLADLGVRIEALTAQLLEVTGGMQSFAASSSATIVQTRGAAEALSRSAGEFGTSVAALEAALDGVFGKLSSGVDAFRDRVNGTVEGVDYNLGVAVSRLAELVAQMNGAPATNRPMPPSEPFAAARGQ